uniref:Synaptotagmin 2 n=1 Tax=Chinchilla lanigera TaxID=34839 RepID=A0A8C2VFQ4_CHILA
MRNIFKRNQEPIVAPATTTATMPLGPADSSNSTESGGAGESQEDMFAKLKEKFFNEINKIPCEGMGPWAGWRGHIFLILSSKHQEACLSEAALS